MKYLVVVFLCACGPNPLAKAWTRTEPTSEEQAAGVSMVNKVLSMDNSGVMTLVGSTSYSPTSALADCSVAESGAGTYATSNNQVTFTFTMYNRIVSGCSDANENVSSTAVPGAEVANYVVNNTLTLTWQLQNDDVGANPLADIAAQPNTTSASEIFEAAKD